MHDLFAEVINYAEQLRHKIKIINHLSISRAHKIIQCAAHDIISLDCLWLNNIEPAMMPGHAAVPG